MKYSVYELYETIVEVDIDEINLEDVVRTMSLADYIQAQAFLNAAQPHRRISRNCVKSICMDQDNRPFQLVFDVDNTIKNK